MYAILVAIRRARFTHPVRYPVRIENCIMYLVLLRDVLLVVHDMMVLQTLLSTLFELVPEIDVTIDPRAAECRGLTGKIRKGWNARNRRLRVPLYRLWIEVHLQLAQRILIVLSCRKYWHRRYSGKGSAMRNVPARTQTSTGL